MTHQELRDREDKEKDTYSENLGIRIHRALSWLNRAEQCSDDADSHVIFLWIAFNAAYAYEICFEDSVDQKKMFEGFIDRLCKLDNENRMEHLVWDEFAHSIRVLLDNKYVFQPFWNHLNNKKTTEKEWKVSFARAKSSAKYALRNRNTAKVLTLVLSRVYTLRNQIVHGGATWNSSVNRRQVTDGSKFMGRLVPLLIEIMMDNPDEPWDKPCYPVVN